MERAPRIFEAIHGAIAAGLVRSCHDLSEGGLAVSLAEMAFAGGLGTAVDLGRLGKSAGIGSDAVLLFSESNTRFLVEVPREHGGEFEAKLAGLPCVRVGSVTDEARVTVRGLGGDIVVDSRCADLKEAWKRPLAWE
jgi:phosphoribosylformylglycinamidine synthase